MKRHKIKRFFGTGGADDDWKRRCASIGTDPHGIFTSRVEGPFHIIIEEFEGRTISWRTTKESLQRHFRILGPVEIDKSLESYG